MNDYNNYNEYETYTGLLPFGGMGLLYGLQKEAAKKIKNAHKGRVLENMREQGKKADTAKQRFTQRASTPGGVDNMARELRQDYNKADARATKAAEKYLRKQEQPLMSPTDVAKLRKNQARVADVAHNRALATRGRDMGKLLDQRDALVALGDAQRDANYFGSDFADALVRRENRRIIPGSGGKTYYADGGLVRLGKNGLPTPRAVQRRMLAMTGWEPLEEQMQNTRDIQRALRRPDRFEKAFFYHPQTKDYAKKLLDNRAAKAAKIPVIDPEVIMPAENMNRGLSRIAPKFSEPAIEAEVLGGSASKLARKAKGLRMGTRAKLAMRFLRRHPKTSIAAGALGALGLGGAAYAGLGGAAEPTAAETVAAPVATGFDRFRTGVGNAFSDPWKGGAYGAGAGALTGGLIGLLRGGEGNRLSTALHDAAIGGAIGGLGGAGYGAYNRYR